MIVVRFGLIRARDVAKRDVVVVIIVVARASFVGWSVWCCFFMVGLGFESLYNFV